MDHWHHRVCYICTRPEKIWYDGNNNQWCANGTHQRWILNSSVRRISETHASNRFWVGLSTTGGLHLAKSFDGCDGIGSLLRAKSVGMLSILFFIELMTKHRNHTDVKIKYVSDNLEYINRSKEHLSYINLYPNTTFSAKYDITKQIYLNVKTRDQNIISTYIWSSG